MIGTHPCTLLAPLDYRYALDAAMSTFSGAFQPMIFCQAPALHAEVSQRFPHPAEIFPFPAALWIEPIKDTWKTDLLHLVQRLQEQAFLVVVASQPLARLLPERASWHEQPFCMLPGGMNTLSRALRSKGYIQQEIYGMHSMVAIGLNTISHQFERLGRPDIGDRLHFQARLHYCKEGALAAAFSTVALLIARKEEKK